MDVEELQRLIDEETFPYELNPEWEVVTNVKVVEAARMWLNPNIKAAAVRLANSGQLHPLAHIALSELPALYKAIAKDVVAAALTPGDTE